MTQVTFQVNGNDPISQRLNAMLENARQAGLQAYLATTVYKQYQQFQLARWKSGGTGETSASTSEGDEWSALNTKYLKRKRKKYASFDYSGNQILVATGALLKSVVGPGNGQQLLISGQSMTITTSLEYAPYVSAMRYFGGLGQASMDTIRQGVQTYLMGAGT